MGVNTTDGRNKRLAQAILDAVGDPDPETRSLTASFWRAGEWQQAAIDAMIYAMDAGLTVPGSLVRQAVSEWPNDMGPLLARKFTAWADRV